MNKSTNTTPDNGANNQPTVNERLDEILYAHNDAIKSLHHKIKYQNLNPTPDEILGMEDAVSATAKQALTSLIKELVAEAKPGIHPYLDSKIDGGYAQVIYGAGVLNYQNNLLKALEEV